MRASCLDSTMLRYKTSSFHQFTQTNLKTAYPRPSDKLAVIQLNPL